MFLRREREGKQNKEIKEGVLKKFSMCRSVPIRQAMVLCHPGCTSSRLRAVLAPQVRVSTAPGAGMPEFRSELTSSETSSRDPYANVLCIYRLHVSQSRHVRKYRN